MKHFPLFWIPLLPLLGAAFNLLVGRKMSRATVHFVGVGAALGALVVSMVAVFRDLYPLAAAAHHHEHVRLAYTWFDWIAAGAVNIKLGLAADQLTAVMLIVVTFVGSLIHIYSMGYMADDPDYARFFGYLNLFTGAMLLLVLGDNLIVLFVGWEGVGLCSYLLIGFWYDKDGTQRFGSANATAGKKAFIEAVLKAKPAILEPIVKIRITAPDSNMGDLAGDLSGRRGRINGSESKSLGRIVIEGEAPLAELEGYESRLKSITGGEGSYSIELSHYAPVPATIQKQLADAYQRASDD